MLLFFPQLLPFTLLSRSSTCSSRQPRASNQNMKETLPKPFDFLPVFSLTLSHLLNTLNTSFFVYSTQRLPRWSTDSTEYIRKWTKKFSKDRHPKNPQGSRSPSASDPDQQRVTSWKHVPSNPFFFVDDDTIE